MTESPFRPRTVRIHGHDVSYRMSGEGPTVVLIHGIAGSSTTWRAVMPALAEHYTVIAPDLLGHGQSAKPRGDYSLGAYASGVRDLLAVLGQERVTVVGHSLGGGVAMQFAYQFPERIERLVLVASGGLGKEVSPLLKAVTLPGAEYVLPLLLHRRIREVGEWPAGLARRVGWRPSVTLAEVWRSYTTLTDRHGQHAFVHTVRSVIDVAGQRVSAHDRLYLAEALPTLIVWGDQDRIIPVAHAHLAAEAMGGARLEILEGAGHFLPWRNADWFLGVLEDFLKSTTPTHVPEARWRELLISAPPDDEKE
ncbi:MAG TPA: alpha/beta fold hydrolase [Acidimicrobiales bacterium]|nr:alpha/beta fold hydrolase [Acidimicrobiales bacterium]